MAPISAVDDEVVSIVAKSDLAAFFFARFFGRHRLLQYDVKKNTLVAVASCDTTRKKILLVIASLVNDN